MVRARLAFLALAGNLLLITGCSTFSGSPLFARHHGRCHDTTTATASLGCGCDSIGSISGFEGPVLVPPDATFVPPPNGTIMAPPTGTIMTPPPPGSTAPPPRIVPIPQANPSPYSPTGLRKLFSREP